MVRPDDGARSPPRAWALMALDHAIRMATHILIHRGADAQHEQLALLVTQLDDIKNEIQRI